jgi:hypothetical protein
MGKLVVGTLGCAAIAAIVCASAVSTPAVAEADTVAYLVNVTVRPGYNFSNANEALAYGNGLCGRMAAGRGYPELVNDVKRDFAFRDDYQASYLINQSAQELCPAQIWHLRQTAAGYRPGP